jgi:LysM repeat protein
MRQLFIILILSGLLLTACGGTPTPDIEATVQVAIAATLTALPTNTPTPDVDATVGAAIAATQAAQPTNTPTSTFTPTPTETLTPPESPAPTDTPSPPDTPGPAATNTPEPTATPAQVVHVVQEGETLFEIAGEYGVSVETLMAANDITDRGLVRVGQELTIPPSDAVAVEAEPTGTTVTPTGEGEPDLGDRDVTSSEAEPTGTSTPIPTEIPLAELPVENKILIIETALRANESVAVKGVAFGGEAGKEAILVAIETQGGAGSVTDETTLLETTTSLIYAYEGNQRLDIGANFVVVQALDDLGNDIWYAVASMDDIGLLVGGEITALEFVQRIRVSTP